jgi:hypothetical protein
MTADVTIDGIALTTANFPSIVKTQNNITFDTTTGIMNAISGTAWENGSFSINGLPLGLHTVRFTKTSGTAGYLYSFDVITPIHASDFRNPSALIENRSFTPIKKEQLKAPMGEAKVLLKFDARTNEILESKGVASVHDNGTGDFLVFFEKRFKTPPISLGNGSIQSGHANVGPINISNTTHLQDSHKAVRVRTEVGNTYSNTIVFDIAVFGELDE